jgi:Ser/Thr protein kinase RdoA (MazF antagonist)
MNPEQSEQVQALLHAAGLPSLLETSALSGGYANDLYRLTLNGPPGTVVARFWRRDPARAATELAVMQRAAAVVAVPTLLAADLTSRPPVALLEDVPGVNAAEALRLFPQDTAQVGEVLGRAFAALRSVYFDISGLFSRPDLRPQPWPESSPAQQLLDFVRPLIWSEVALSALGADTQRLWWQLIESQAPLLNTLPAEAQLVHADANPKNVMVRRTPEGWTLGAVLDWEFALSGPGLMDLGNLLRFEPRTGSAFATGVLRGWNAVGGTFPAHALEQARLLDLYSLAGFVNTPSSALYRQVVASVQANTARRRL